MSPHLDQETKVCLYCNHQNDATLDMCANCGKPLPTTTIEVTRIRPSGHTRVPNIQAMPGKVIFYIPGQSAPHILNAQKTMTIGRAQLSNPMDIDLSPFNAHLLGVSRLHATLHFQAEGVFLEDLESSNGTWVNENRLLARKLHPIRSGDMLRFGNFLTFIYFSNTHAAQITFRLREIGTPSGQPRQGINLPYLKNSLVPFLEALTAIQILLYKAQNDALSEVSIASITLSSDKKGVTVTMNGANEVVEYTAHSLMALKQGLKNRLLMPQTSNEIQTRLMDAAAIEKVADIETIKTPQELTPEAQEEIKPLAENFLKKYLAQLNVDDQQSYLEQLLPHFHQLILGNLELAIE
jgi:hypothetical protein